MMEQMKSSNIVKILLSIVFFISFSTGIYAAEFSVVPNSGSIRINKEFVTDIMIDTKGVEVVLARAVLTFDPSMIKVMKAENNASLFCSYPEDKQSIDNTNGVVVLMGFCQSGNGIGYKTEGEDDLFARITYASLKKGTVNIKWEYTGIDEEFNSIIMKDGSPTTSVLTSAPTDAKFTAYDPGNIVTPPPVTALGVTISWTMIIVGIGLVLLGIVVTTISLRYGNNKGIRTLIQDE